jgi:hypothetical protein
LLGYKTVAELKKKLNTKHWWKQFPNPKRRAYPT